jgi:hypothetical protein
MNRKQFLQMGGCCAALVALQRMSGAVPAAASEPAPPAPPVPVPAGPPVSTAEHRVEFAEQWAKRFFDVFDAHLDEATREKIMKANGRACHENSLRGQNIQPIGVDDFIARVQARIGAEAIHREGDTIYFHYVQNPRGLKVADGYCLCPLVETGPAGLSGTYCFCSVGYVQHMFEVFTGHPVRVELLESLKRGGKGCKFKITLV